MPSKSGKSQNTKLVPFLRKLQEFVNGVVPKDVGAWNDEGNRFLVFNHKRFDELVKQHFQWTSPQTFNRQLNLYDFTKEDSPHWSFGHPCFLRDEPSKIFEIKRFARASDKEDGESHDDSSASRVQFLENKVTALQSMVNDLSVKLAKIQVALNHAATGPAQAATEDLPGRKRSITPCDEDMDTEDTEDFCINQDSPAVTNDLLKVETVAAGESRKDQAQDFLSSLITTREFQTVVSSALQHDPQPSFSASSLLQEEIC